MLVKFLSVLFFLILSLSNSSSTKIPQFLSDSVSGDFATNASTADISVDVSNVGDDVRLSILKRGTSILDRRIAKTAFGTFGGASSGGVSLSKAPDEAILCRINDSGLGINSAFVFTKQCTIGLFADDVENNTGVNNGITFAFRSPWHIRNMGPVEFCRLFLSSPSFENRSVLRVPGGYIFSTPYICNEGTIDSSSENSSLPLDWDAYKKIGAAYPPLTMPVLTKSNTFENFGLLLGDDVHASGLDVVSAGSLVADGFTMDGGALSVGRVFDISGTARGNPSSLSVGSSGFANFGTWQFAPLENIHNQGVLRIEGASKFTARTLKNDGNIFCSELFDIYLDVALSSGIERIFNPKTIVICDHTRPCTKITIFIRNGVEVGRTEEHWEEHYKTIEEEPLSPEQQALVDRKNAGAARELAESRSKLSLKKQLPSGTVTNPAKVKVKTQGQASGKGKAKSTADHPATAVEKASSVEQAPTVKPKEPVIPASKPEVSGKGPSVRGPPKLLPPASAQHNHHIFPQRFREDFLKIGIDIDKYCVTIGEQVHLRAVHGKGVLKNDLAAQFMPGKWNDRWAEFFRINPSASQKEAFQFGGRLMEEFGLEGYKLVPYK